MQSVLEILNKCVAYFAEKGIETPKLDAEILLAHALGCKRLELFLRFEDPVPEEKLAPFREMVRRRAKREPLQHIIGSVDFFSIKLKCDSRALVPRPETEELCEMITEKFFTIPDAAISVLDLGTGSGAIALAIANHYKNANVDAVDFSDNALELAKENAESLGISVNIFKSNWFENITNQYDLILSNPPYLTEEEVKNASPEVKKFDPHCALASPDNGMGDLRAILSEAKKFLKDGGILVCECGLNQPSVLAKEAVEKFGFSFSETAPDLSRRERFLICKK